MLKDELVSEFEKKMEEMREKLLKEKEEALEKERNKNL